MQLLEEAKDFIDDFDIKFDEQHHRTKRIMMRILVLNEQSEYIIFLKQLLVKPHISHQTFLNGLISMIKIQLTIL